MNIHALVNELKQYNPLSKMTEDVHASSQLALVKLKKIDFAAENYNHGST
jgi:hypothetical protein